MNFDPYPQTSAMGSFTIESDGLIVGTAYPDPAIRYDLAGGVLDDSQTLPMWGGMAILETIPTVGGTSQRPEQGGHIHRATNYTEVTGFSVFDQNYHGVNWPQSPVSSVTKGQGVHFYRLGSKARIALEIDPALVSLEGGAITSQVSWDFVNQKLIAFATTALPVRILQVKVGNCMAPVYDVPSQQLTWNRNASAAVCLI
jgi:hypothetical protein